MFMYVNGSIQQGFEGVYFEADVVHTMNLQNICDHHTLMYHIQRMLSLQPNQVVKKMTYRRPISLIPHHWEAGSLHQMQTWQRCSIGTTYVPPMSEIWRYL